MALSTAILTFALPGAVAAQVFAGWSTVETDHFRFHFAPRPGIETSAFAVQLEEAYTELRRNFDVSFPRRINFYVWTSSDDAEAVLGRPLGFASPKHLLIHATSEQTRGHELTHLFVHYAANPEVTTRFISEGTAVAFDLSGRDRLQVARAAAPPHVPSVPQLWTDERALPDAAYYAVAGAFVEHLLSRGGRDRFFQLLRRQTFADARRIYGADLDRLVTEFQTAVSSASAAQGTQPGAGGPVEELRALAAARMRLDRQRFTPEEMKAIESLYQAASRDTIASEARARLLALVEKYPKANRAGCAMLYLAQRSQGEEREQFLKRAIADHSDDWYGDGTQVGAFARAQLAVHYAHTNRRDEALRIAADVQRLFPRAIDHSGGALVDSLRSMKLLE